MIISRSVIIYCLSDLSLSDSLEHIIHVTGTRDKCRYKQICQMKKKKKSNTHRDCLEDYTDYTYTFRGGTHTLASASASHAIIAKNQSLSLMPLEEKCYRLIYYQNARSHQKPEYAIQVSIICYVTI